MTTPEPTTYKACASTEDVSQEFDKFLSWFHFLEDIAYQLIMVRLERVTTTSAENMQRLDRNITFFEREIPNAEIGTGVIPHDEIRPIIQEIERCRKMKLSNVLWLAWLTAE